MSDAPHAGRKEPKDLSLVVGATVPAGQGVVTARQAGTISDLKLPVSPKAVGQISALENLAKAINLALQSDFLETELDSAYKAARVYEGAVEIQHRDYIGLGDGVMAEMGKATKSFQLTFRGPDPASPEGKAWINKHGRAPVSGLFNLLGRKLNLLQEYEDKVPSYVEQMLDRLEAAQTIVGWNRHEWQITTELIGLDVIIRPAGEVGA